MTWRKIIIIVFIILISVFFVIIYQNKMEKPSINSSTSDNKAEVIDVVVKYITTLSSGDDEKIREYILEYMNKGNAESKDIDFIKNANHNDIESIIRFWKRNLTLNPDYARIKLLDSSVGWKWNTDNSEVTITVMEGSEGVDISLKKYNGVWYLKP
jgi:hypothetical protein